jgi:hypothetical protein
MIYDVSHLRTLGFCVKQSARKWYFVGVAYPTIIENYTICFSHVRWLRTAIYTEHCMTSLKTCMLFLIIHRAYGLKQHNLGIVRPYRINNIRKHNRLYTFFFFFETNCAHSILLIYFHWTFYRSQNFPLPNDFSKTFAVCARTRYR